MIDIEWDTPDPSGSRYRNRKASTIHGWVTKLRGTLTGNERVRSRGIREMKHARAIRKYNKARKAGDSGRGSRRGSDSIMSWFSFWPTRSKQPSRMQLAIHRDYASGRKGGGNTNRSYSSRRSKPQHDNHGAQKSHLTRNTEHIQPPNDMERDAQRGRHKEQPRRSQRRSRRGAAPKADQTARRPSWRA